MRIEYFKKKDVTFLMPDTMNVEPIYESLNTLDGPLAYKFFFKDIKQYKEELPNLKEEIIIYIGAVSGTQSLTIEQLLYFKKRNRMVHLCCDANSKDWHPLLNQYIDKDVFDLTVNINGSFDWPK